MGLIRNLLALIGLIVVAGAIWLGIQYGSFYDELRAYDGKALGAYAEMGKTLLETGDAAEATAWKVKVNEELSRQDVEDIMKLVANEHDMKLLGELLLSKEVEAMSGEPFRFMKIFMFSNALSASKILSHSDAFVVYLPFRIALLEDVHSQLWLYTSNPDIIIHGGKPFPAEIKEEALGIRGVIHDIMNRGASGKF